MFCKKLMISGRYKPFYWEIWTSNQLIRNAFVIWDSFCLFELMVLEIYKHTWKCIEFKNSRIQLSNVAQIDMRKVIDMINSPVILKIIILRIVEKTNRLTNFIRNKKIIFWRRKDCGWLFMFKQNTYVIRK